MKYYTGLDLHKRYSEITIIDENGRVIKQARLPNVAEDINLFLAGYEQNKIAVEASYNWYWLVDNLQEQGYEVKLAHPYKTKIIGEAKIKTDKIDSLILAKLIRSDFLPESYIADKSIRDEREYLRYRIFMVYMSLR